MSSVCHCYQTFLNTKQQTASLTQQLPKKMTTTDWAGGYACMDKFVFGGEGGLPQRRQVSCNLCGVGNHAVWMTCHKG